MSKWKFDLVGNKPKLNKPIFIEGLPGIGNVGKVVADFMIDELKAKKLYDITSHTFPHSVFVNEENLVELPKVEIFYKKGKKNDFLFLVGDIQPTDEVSSYEFSEKILDLFEQFKGKEIITLGGIGLADIPKKPKVYCTGNNKKIIERYKGPKVNEKLHGVVGPIVGVTGLLLGLGEQRKIDAVALLAETYAHPMYLGIKGAKEILDVLNKKFSLGIDIDKLEHEISDLEEEMIKRTKKMEAISKQSKMKVKGTDMNYIG